MEYIDTRPNYLTMTGAAKLKAMILDYWEARGVDNVKVHIISIGGDHVVRSDMKGGKPKAV